MIEWRIFPLSDKYEVSSDGQVRNTNTKRILKPFKHSHGKSREAYNYQPRLDYKLFDGTKFKTMLAHRVVAMTFGIIKGNENVDHINGNAMDNSIQNLRAATDSQNMLNQVARKQFNVKQTKSSKFIGVSKRRNRWEFRVNFQGKLRYRGHADTQEECARDYNNYKLLCDTTFSTTNVIDRPGEINRA